MEQGDAKIDLRTLHRDGRQGALIPSLQRLQAQEGWLPPEGLERLHHELGVPLSQLYGVATFYAQFRLQPCGRHLIRVCHGTACHVSGAAALSEAFEAVLGVPTGATTSDKRFTLERVSCLGCCSLAPVAMIGETTFGNLAANQVKKVLARLEDGEGGGR